VRVRILVALVLACAGWTDLAVATTYLVLPDGTGDFPTIQLAIDAAVDGDTVELGDGTFSGHGNHTIHYRSKTIVVRSLSGDPSLCVIDCQGSPDEYRTGFMIAGDDETYTATLQGVTVTGAYVAGAWSAIYCGEGQPRIEDCVLVRNVTEDVGAGLVTFDSGAIFVRCWFVENASVRSAVGGAAVCESTARFESCYFLRNTGGACCILGGSPEFVDCVFASTPGIPGMAIVSLMASPFLHDCTITGFNPSAGEPVIGLSQDGPITLENTIIAFNHGAETFSCDGSITLRCSDVYGNEGGDWVDCIADQLGQDGNICLDPQFCSENPNEDEDWSIQCDSPCAPALSGCGLIGARDVGCGSSAARSKTWGGVKLLFRE
jgi:hypothetical protein